MKRDERKNSQGLCFRKESLTCLLRQETAGHNARRVLECGMCMLGASKREIRVKMSVIKKISKERGLVMWQLKMPSNSNSTFLIFSY